jgi:site-specific DNA-cytosine methylase
MEKLTDAIGIVLFESEKFGGEKVLRGGICPTLRANKTSSGVIEVMADVNVIGSLESKFESTNRIYDVGGCSPTLSTMQGGNQEPKILEEQIPCKLDKMPNGHLDSLDNAEICDINTPTASTVTSRYYKGIGSHKDNMCIVAMRGRNPNNPSDRTAGSLTEQRLEVNMQGTSNCLTSVQKDNLVIESQVLTPKRTEYGKQIRKAYESGRMQESRHNMTELEPRKDDISNTLTTVQKDNLLLENNIQKVGQISSNGSQCGTVISDNGISANLVAGTHGYANSHIATQYRIRKLTPRECGRLMGVSDEDIDKMAAVNSNTQLYKQFGNSIVVDVMCAMFKNLNIKQGDSNEALQTN